MKIIVIGCDKTGATIIESLVSEGHDVLAIDQDLKKLESITNIHDVMAVCGNGADFDTLKEAGAENAELVIAVTGSDEFNMLSCFLAKRMGAQYTIARIRNPQYNDKGLNFVKQQLDISLVINPEQLVAKELFHMLKLPSAAKIDTFSSRNFEMIELKLKEDSVLDGVSLWSLRSKFNANFLICAVKRGEEVFIPDGNFVLQKGDKIALTANHSEISKLLREMGILQKQAKNIMILGAEKTSYYLARILSLGNNRVTIIDRDEALCNELCEALPKATIINGDSSDQELLLEEGLRSIDAFVALTPSDEKNILISSFASNQNVPKVIARVTRSELAPLAEQFGLESIVSPKKLAADIIVQYARALENSAGSSMETLYRVMDDKVEVLEFKVKSDFPALSIPFKSLKTKTNTLIGGIIRDRKTIIPSGDDMLLSGDKVVVVSSSGRINTLSDILK